MFKIYSKQKELDGMFRGYSLHCGGIVYYPEGVPKELIINGGRTLIPQIKLDKREIAENRHFKIDILSSRGLSQLYVANSFQEIDFDKHIGDKLTIDLLCSGDNIGITLAETPLMRKALMLIKPKTLNDLAELSTDELVGSYDEKKGVRFKIDGYLEEFALTKNEADELIISARKIVFK